MPKIVTFTVKDHAGIPHEYETMLFDPSEGVELYQQVTAAVGDLSPFSYTSTLVPVMRTLPPKPQRPPVPVALPI